LRFQRKRVPFGVTEFNERRQRLQGRIAA